MMQADLDVVVIGAGLSGIGVARYLKVNCPGKRFAILESKPRIGGTWDLFRYPGIRSDSDMHTMGYAFKPWKNAKAISDGESIRDYVQECADENGLTPLIRFEHRVIRAEYVSRDCLWTLTCATPEGEKVITCNFLFSAAGYYKHDEGYLPDFAGYDDFRGTIIHPQFWPEGFDHAGKTIAIIGSGATAVTLTPTLAETAKHVYQIQRSPTYVRARPMKDKVGNILKTIFPGQLGYSLTRWKIIWEGRMRRRRFAGDIEGLKAEMIGEVAKALGDTVDWKTHFTPSYWPGQQRICAIPDGDMFDVLKEGRATMVTGHIDRFTETGILMQDGSHIEADVIVTATGLVLDYFGGMEMTVDSQKVDPGKPLIFKGFMYSNVPNMIYFRGYTNASWTLKVDLVAEYACRLLNHMDRNGYTQVVPVAGSGDFATINTASLFTSGYFVRVAHRLPKHGTSFPWIHKQEYFWDRKTLKRGRVDDGTLTFSTGEGIVFPPEQLAGTGGTGRDIAAE
ncbi:NAD(P)-binding protein [Pseudooceanicola sp. 216_PA32_1]|uniref:NAD(P)-binding protein n=1 Tax=Pseudooceanicola pacificus TaxID=2676438 RepID=A0A844W4A1_9RHOB|nr:NAD(P)/FAD-dependent oxidoreductase [Pseudooceanicola pacificus]MWB77895.1 NAD(P)-binding protein [Pseudooceanicola pacificus]